jgi:transposase-like protein
MCHMIGSMDFDKKALKKKAQSMRKSGVSYGSISRKLGVSKSTLSFWLKNFPLAKKYRERLYTARIKKMYLGPQSNKERRRREIETIIESAKEEISIPLSSDAYRFLGAALYWAEGSKGGAIEITNSDPLLILFMTRWFTNVFKVSPATLKAWLNIYPQQNDKALKRFWFSLTGIPVSRFGKSFVKPISKNIKKNNLYYGTIKIRVPKSTDNKHRIYGWIQGALRPYKKESEAIQGKWIRLRNIEKPVNFHYSKNTLP